MKILIASGKGGVGKSTLSVFFGGALAERRRKTLLIDADAGLGALDVMLKAADRTMNTWFDVYAGRIPLNNAILDITPMLSLIPAPKFYCENIAPDFFLNIVRDLERRYDVIIIDAPAGIDERAISCAKASEKAIFVATADEISVKAAASLTEAVQSAGITLNDCRIVINRFVKKEALKSRLLNIDGVIDKTGLRLIGVIPEDKKIVSSSVTGEYPNERSKFIRAVNRVVSRIEGESVPLSFK